MQMKCRKRFLSFILCMALTVAMALTVTGCNGKTDNGGSADIGTEVNTQIETADDSQGADKVQQLGEGSTKFSLTVADKDGNETEFEILTDKETVGEALLELELIAGDEGDYGLYVKTVNGITADYDTDGTYWAFYIDGEYAQTGVDATKAEEGASYAFKVE